MAKEIDLTAVVTVHNEGLLAHKTLRSVFEAVKEAEDAGYTCEIVVHIDNGDKATKEYFQRYKNDKKVRIFENKFGDLGSSRNFAASRARGKYVAFLDGDDLISSNWYREALKILTKSKDEIVVYPHAILTFGLDEEFNVLTIQEDSRDKESEAALMIGENPRASVVAAQKEIFLRFPYKKMKPGYCFEDYAFNAETLNSGLQHKIAKETVLFYRKSDKSMLTKASGRAVLPYMELFAFDKAKDYKYQDQNKDFKSSLKRQGYRVYKKIRSYNSLNKFITPIAKRAKSFLLVDEKNNVPDFVISEWAKINSIDPELYPYSYLVKRVKNYSAKKLINVGLTYCKLAKEFTKKPDYLFVVPWMTRGGAEKVVFNYINALREIYPDWHFAIITTVISNNVWAKHLPDGVDFIDFGTVADALYPNEQELLFSRIIIQSNCHRMHIINSEFGYEWVRKHKELFKNEFELNVSHFCAEPINGSNFKAIFTYDCPYIFAIFDVIKNIFTDNKVIIERDVERNGFEVGKFKVHYQPEGNLPVRKPKVNLTEDGKLHLLWASRIVPTKLPELVTEIGRRLDPNKFRIDVFGAFSDLVKKDIFDGIASINYRGSFDGFANLPIDKSDVLLYTSFDDGLPNVLLEAAVAGLPIIASNDGGVGELIKDKKTGRLIEDYLNPDAYVKVIKEIMANPEVLPKYAENAQKLVKERHSWQSFVDTVKKDIG